MIVLHPHSLGTISLASGDPLDRPLIDPKVLEDQRDKDACMAGNCFVSKKQTISIHEKLRLVGETSRGRSYYTKVFLCKGFTVQKFYRTKNLPYKG